MKADEFYNETLLNQGFRMVNKYRNLSLGTKLKNQTVKEFRERKLIKYAFFTLLEYCIQKKTIKLHQIQALQHQNTRLIKKCFLTLLTNAQDEIFERKRDA